MYYKLFARSLFAGLVIGLGGIANLSCDNKILGAFLFSIGLLAVLMFNFDLFTGKVCYKKHTLDDVLEDIFILLGNCIGAMFMGIIAYMRGIDATDLVVAKLQKPFYVWIIDGIICGICIAIAVKGYRRTNNPIVPIIGVMTFILTGSEHCIADMFYISTTREDFVYIVPMMVYIIIGNVIGGQLFSFIEDIEEKS